MNLKFVKVYFKCIICVLLVYYLTFVVLEFHVYRTVPRRVGLQLDDESEAYAVGVRQRARRGISAHRFVTPAAASEGGSDKERRKKCYRKDC